MLRSLLPWAGFLILIPTPALASPWTLPQGVAVVQLGVSAQTARAEFNDSSVLQGYALNQQLSAHDYQLTLKYGITSWWQVDGLATYRYLFNVGDLYPSTTSTCTQPVQEGATCYDPNTEVWGPADLWLTTKVRLHQNPWVLSLAPTVKIPLGYVGPSTEVMSVPFPLGDGQWDAGMWVLGGQMVSPVRILLRGGVGYLRRLGPPPDQLMVEVKVGQQPLPWLILAMGLSARLSLREDGTWLDVGLDPSTGTLSPEPISAGREWTTADAGVIVKLKPDVELQLTGRYTGWGHNVPAMRGGEVGLAFYF